MTGRGPTTVISFLFSIPADRGGVVVYRPPISSTGYHYYTCAVGPGAGQPWPVCIPACNLNCYPGYPISRPPVAAAFSRSPSQFCRTRLQVGPTGPPLCCNGRSTGNVSLRLAAGSPQSPGLSSPIRNSVTRTTIIASWRLS